MSDRVLHHSIVLPVKPFVGKAIDGIKIPGNTIKVVIQKFVHYKDGSICDIGGPFIDVIEKCFNDFLRAQDAFDVGLRFGKKSKQPCLAPGGSCKIQFMENGKFLFRVKDGNIAECGFISLHSK